MKLLKLILPYLLFTLFVNSTFAKDKIDNATDVNSEIAKIGHSKPPYIPATKVAVLPKFTSNARYVSIAQGAVGGWVERVYSAARRFAFKTPKGAKVYAFLHEPLQTLPNGLKVQRIREGLDPDKIAVIGRKMPGVVDDTAAHLRKSDITTDTFQWTKGAAKDFQERVADYRKIVGDPNARLPFDEVKKSLGYAENKAWIKEKVQKGYTILDMGDPLNSNAKEGLSAFYELEKTIVFGN